MLVLPMIKNSISFPLMCRQGLRDKVFNNLGYSCFKGRYKYSYWKIFSGFKDVHQYGFRLIFEDMSEKPVGYLFSAVLLCHMVGIVFFLLL